MDRNVLNDVDCATILENALERTDFQIVGHKIYPLSDKATGFLGEHLKVDIRYVVDGVETVSKFFVKRKPTVTAQHDIVIDFIVESNAFSKELFVYRTLIGDDDVDWAPKIYFSKDDELLVLEDLTLRGYGTPVRGVKFDVEHCKVGLRSIARMHAFGITREHNLSIRRQRHVSLFEEYPDKFREVLFNRDPGTLAAVWFESGIRCLHNFIDHHPNVRMPRDVFKTLVGQKYVEILEHMRPSKDYLNTISHGDLWCNNMLFRYDADGEPEHCYLIDYQLLRYTPPANDVLMFLEINTDEDFLRKHLTDMQIYYYETLTEELKRVDVDVSQILPWEQFENSCDHYALTWKLIKCIYESVLGLDDAIFDDLLKDKERYKDVMFYKRDEFVLDMYAEHETYRRTIVERIDELQEMFLIDTIRGSNCARILKEKRNSIKQKKSVK